MTIQSSFLSLFGTLNHKINQVTTVI